MQCPACHTPLIPHSRYCHCCGQATHPDMPAIDHSTAPELDRANLHRLGPRQYLEQVAAPGQHPLSERRTVTTLFADTVNSTGIAEHLDPEDVTNLMNEAFREMIDPIQRYDGTLARLMGDGILCLFGAPVAHEDDARRACRAACEIIRGIRRLSGSVRERFDLAAFDVRIGISTGLAVVGEVGTEIRSEYTAMGDAVNLAARLQHAAEPGTVLICDSTHRLIASDMACRDAGTITVRGRSRPVRVFMLDSESTTNTPPLPPVSADPLPDLVGRDEELATLTTCLDELNDGQGGVVIISGKAGIGKSRLLQEARHRSPHPILWLSSQCSAYTTPVSHASAREIAGQLLSLHAPGSGREVMKQVRRFVRRQYAPSAASSLPLTRSQSLTAICAVLGKLLQAPLNKSETQLVENLSADTLREKILTTLIELICLTAPTRPLAIAIEDLHWIDPESGQIARSLAAAAREAGFLLVLVTRPDQATFALDGGSSGREHTPPAREIHLDCLSREHSLRMLRQLLEVDHLPEHVVGPIVHRAEGNAFFLQEIVRSLLDSGSLARGDADRLNDCRIESLEIPHSLQAAILSRVDRLPLDCKPVLQTAAVLGRSFHRDHLDSMLKAHMTQSEIHAAVDTLIAREFLYWECPADSLQTAGSLQFFHALTQEVVYGSLLLSRRRQLHSLAGDTLELLAHAGSPAPASLIAFHFERGHPPAKAIPYLAAAASDAAAVYSLDSAASFYGRALELSNEVPCPDAAVQRALLEGLGDIHYLHSEYQEALDRYDQALGHAGSARERNTLNRKRGRLLEKWGRYDRAKEAYERGLDGMRENLDPCEAGRTYAGLCLVYYHRNELDLALELGNLALLMERQADDYLGIAQACNNLGVVLTKKGDWPQARAYFTECSRIWEDTEDVYSLAACYNNWGLLAQEEKDWPQAIALLEKSRQLFGALGNRHGLARVHDNLGEIYHLMGDAMKSEQHLCQAMTILGEIGITGNIAQPEMWQSGAW